MAALVAVVAACEDVRLEPGDDAGHGDAPVRYTECPSGVGRAPCTSEDCSTFDDSLCGSAAVVDLVAHGNLAHTMTPCMLLGGGRVDCWGNNSGQRALAPPSVRIAQWNVTPGTASSYLMLVGEDGRVRSAGVSRGIYARDILSVAAPTADGSCGLRADGRIVCNMRPRGSTPRPQTDVQGPAPTMRFSQILGTASRLCAVSLEPALHCWAFDPTANTYQEILRVAQVASPIRDLDLVGASIVWVDATGIARHAGALDDHLAPPEGTWQTLSFSPGYACGVTVDEGVRCWGDPTVPGELLTPPGLAGAVAVEVMPALACALTASAGLRCWGLSGRAAMLDRDDVVRLGPELHFETQAGLLMQASLPHCCAQNDSCCASPYRVIDDLDARVTSLIGNGEHLGYQCADRGNDVRSSCWGATHQLRAKRVDVFAGAGACALAHDSTTCTLIGGSTQTLPHALTQWQSLVPTNAVFAPLCGRTAQGLVSCARAAGDAVYAIGTYERARATSGKVCGQSATAIECTDLDPPVPGVYRDFRPTAQHLTTLSEDGTVRCWDWQTGTAAACSDVVPTTGYVAISNWCGILSSGAVRCWGAGYPSPHALHGATTVVAGHGFGDLGTGVRFCAGWPDGMFRCGGQAWALSPSGPFTDMRIGANVACGRRPDGVLLCWPAAPDASWVATIAAGFQARVYAAGQDLVCASSDLEAQCWRAPGAAEGLVIEPGARDITTGRDRVCILDAKGAARCWPIYLADEISFPADAPALTQLAVGDDFVCGLTEDHRIYCVASPTAPHLPQLSEGGYLPLAAGARIAKLAAGTDHLCALTTTGRVACFGSDLSGQASPPLDDGYTDLTSGTRFSCATSPGRPLRCWGEVWYE